MTGPGPDQEWHDPDVPVGGGPAGLRWFWLLILIATAAWFPQDPYWQSHDFTALAWARDFSHVVADFSNPQYGVSGIWSFYRPLITLSFWLDGQLAGAEPFLPHLLSALVHGMNAMLVALLWARFLAPAAAFGAGLLWGLLPAHAGAVMWTAGRADVYCAFWCLSSLWLLCRHWEGERWGRPASLLAFLLALCCKELAFVLPGLVLLLALGLGGTARPLRAALIHTIPYLALLALFLIWRFWALGVFLGLDPGWTLQPGPALAGLGRTALEDLNPLWSGGSERLSEWLGHEPPSWVPWLGFLPVLGGVIMLLVDGKLALPGLTLLAFCALCIPLVPFWNAPADIQNPRYFYLPSAALIGLLAAGGSRIWILGLLVWVAPLLEIRADYRTFERELQAMHDQLLVDTAEEPPGRMLFVAGLPRHNAKGTVPGFDHGTDRLLEPPFGSGRHRIFAFRPLFDSPSVYRLRNWEDEEEQYMLPESITITFEGSSILRRHLETNPLPELSVRLEGPEKLTTDRLRQIELGTESDALVMDVRATHYRITVFTAAGYLAVVAPNRGDPSARDGRVELRDLFGAEGRYARPGSGALLTLGLRVPLSMDLSPRLPVLIEAGHLVELAGTAFFRPTHSARQFLWFEFDRGFPAFAHEVR